MRVWCRATLRSNAKETVKAQKLANVPLECGKRARGSKPAGRRVDGKRPSCPVREPSTCSRAAAAPAAGWTDGRTDARSSASSRCRQGCLKAGGGATTEEAVVHFTPFQTFREKGSRKAAVFTHFTNNRETGTGLISPRSSGSSSSISFHYDASCQERADTLIYVKSKKWIYVQSDLLPRTVTATIMQRTRDD